MAPIGEWLVDLKAASIEVDPLPPCRIQSELNILTSPQPLRGKRTNLRSASHPWQSATACSRTRLLPLFVLLTACLSLSGYPRRNVLHTCVLDLSSLPYTLPRGRLSSFVPYFAKTSFLTCFEPCFKCVLPPHFFFFYIYNEN